ncbi:unnamed protein product [Spirodela intermedia]|uniref:Uncharacterized protein n=1 Tax=Spirodela intermedia TaxID=51605 RepID=A0A7I8K520_SPIIN|nr:unnamed protein product [Spirodela intermedia]
MGMGKTIQAISLVLTARSLHMTSSEPHQSDIHGSSSASSSAPLLPVAKSTLVICPLVAVIQWVGEIERYTKEGSVRVLVYHGAKRLGMNYNFNDYDFVLTTYSTIEGDFRRNVMPPKEKCQWCGRLLYPSKMKVHLKYFCGPSAQKTEKQSKQTKKGAETSSLKKRQRDLHNIRKDDVSGLKATSSIMNSVLHSVRWDRIILDEAHYIKDRRSSTARAVFALQSSYKWALSGTPLQNRVGELYSLIRFLQIKPYSFYFCKDCDCKILDYSTSVHCENCAHGSARHFCWWNRYITKPIQTKGHLIEGKRAMILLKEKLLKSIVLRRTKKGRAADLVLPPRIVCLRRDALDSNEHEFYEALYTQSQTQFGTYVSAGTLMNNYAHIFDLLTRLRQAVDHPYLVVYSRTVDAPNESNENTSAGYCGICHDPAEDPVVTSCDHSFCRACLLDITPALRTVSCPSCSKPLTVDLTTANSGEKRAENSIIGFKHSSILNRLNIQKFKTSTKIDALKEEIMLMAEADSSAKGIVFSQFTSFLDLIKYSLVLSGVSCVQLVGSMSLAERERAISSFTEDADCKIFLMSLKAGGVALNLTVASHVFLMDPWWNPAVERQAQDRIHRIGQHKPIRTVRFLIEDTIEERILQLQKKKEMVFEGTVGDSADAMAKLTEEDLKFLFQN